MKIRFLNSLRFRIFLMSLVAVAPLIALSVYHAQEDRNRENKDLRDEAIQLVNFTLIEEAQTIDGTRQLLLSLSNLPMLYFKDSLVCKEYLSKLLTKSSRYVNLGVVNNNGTLFASGRSAENKKDYSKSEFFKEVMDKSGFSVGEYSVDPISHKRIINLGYPLLDEKQRIKAVLFASLDVSYIDLIEKDLAKIFHEKSLFIKIDDEGNILATNSPSNELIKNVVTPAFLKIIPEQNNGIIEAPGPNKQNYLFVFATTKSNLFQDKLYLVVGADKERFFSEINATLFRNLFLIGALFAIILAGVLILSDKYILKTVKKLINATNEMSTGNLSVRSNVGYGSGELGQLAMTFDRMAESLEKQSCERRKVDEERSKLFTEVQEAENQLRLLSRRLLETQESERKNISRELHDEIGQTLTAAKINLQSIQRITKSSKIAEDLAITISYIEQSLQQVRDISLNLRPSILDDLGIEAALRWLLRQIAESAKIKCKLVFDLSGVELSKEMQLNCYRIAQEALNNIAKHSRAKNAVVNLTAVEGAIHLIIKDNGKGFKVKEVREQALKGKSLGILSMEERAQLDGGEFKITSSTKNGTEIHTIFQL